MREIPFPHFINKVLTTRERVQFSYVDPYGHMNASRYLEIALNHRNAAAEDSLKISAVYLAKSLGLGFAVKQLLVRFVSPAILNEWVSVSSWTSKLGKNDFELVMVISGETSSKVKAVFKIEFQCIDLSTGRTRDLPASLPTELDTDVTGDLPSSQTIIESLKYFPADFL